MASWFIFTTSGVNPDPLDPTLYSLVGSKPTCPGNAKICAIFADNDGFNHPVISQLVEDDMVRALQFSLDQPLAILRT